MFGFLKSKTLLCIFGKPLHYVVDVTACWCQYADICSFENNCNIKPY